MTRHPPQILPAPEWRLREAAHRERLRPWVEGHRARRAAAVPHPVIDFMFTYYSFRPGQLLRWSPGFGVGLGDPDGEFASRRHFASDGGVAWLCTSSMSERERGAVVWTGDLLEATAGRPGRYGCSGLHEWAMVYRLTREQIRHAKFPLRLPPEEIERVVEAGALSCTHYDAFRFFTPQARPLNAFQPSIDGRVDLEQPGCLHTNMDLYKWAYKLAPWIPSELVADAFLLAVEIRELDMRASPYDLSEMGYEPVAVETAAGRAHYEAEQRGFARRAEPLRQRLLAHCRSLQGEFSRRPVPPAIRG